MKRFLSYILILVGLSSFLFTGYIVYQRNSPRRLSFEITSYPKTNTVTGSKIPKRISIKKVGIDLPVIPATLIKGEWDATMDGVSFLSSSVVPGEKGNSIFYGHNWRNLLGNLPEVKPGEKVVVEYDDSSKSVFTVEYTTVVDPKDTHILNPSSDKRITLYTCTGFLDSKRFVVVAILNETKALLP